MRACPSRPQSTPWPICLLRHFVLQHFALSMQELAEGVEASRVGVRALANHRAALANEAAAGEAQAAVARRRIPELEADKKTAAAARVSPAHNPREPARTVATCCYCLHCWTYLALCLFCNGNLAKKLHLNHGKLQCILAQAALACIGALLPCSTT